MKISKNLIGALAALSISCAGAERRNDGVTVEHYTLDYDSVPPEMAVRIYALDHNGQSPVNTEQVLSYLWSPRDLNMNGVLDLHNEAIITMRGNTLLELHEKITTRREASSTGNEEFSEHRIVRNSNGTYSRHVHDTAIMPSLENIELGINLYRNGVFQRNMDVTGRLLERLLGREPRGLRHLIHNR